MSSRTKSLFAAYFILFLDHFGYALLFPIFPLLFLNPIFDILPSTMDEITRNILLGFILAAYPFAQFFGAPFFGDISDHFGRKKALYWTIAGTIVGYALTAIAIHFKLFYLILFSRLVTGFFAGNLAICMAIIADMNSGKRRRGKGLSYVSALIGVSWILALIVTTLFTNPRILQLFHPALPFWIVAALSVLSYIALMKMYRETVILKPRLKLEVLKGVHQIIRMLEYKQLRVLYLVLFFWFFGFFITMQWATPLSIEKYRVDLTQIVWLLIAVNFFWACSGAFLNPWLINHSSLWKITLWSLFLVSLFFFFGAGTGFFFYFAAAYVLAAIFAAMAWGNSMTLISLATTPENQGKSLGMGNAMLSLGQFLGPLFGGFVAGFSIIALFYTSALIVFISFLLLLVYVARRKNKLLTRVV